VSEKTEGPREVEFVVTEAPYYRVYAANGTISSITPRGDIKVDFLVEAAQRPGRVRHAYDPETQQLGPELEDPEGSPRPYLFERRVECGVVLSPREAYLLGNWLKGAAALFGYHDEEKVSDGDSTAGP